MRNFFLLLALFFTLVFDSPAAPPAVNPEITHLLNFVESSKVRFIRNGTEYSPKEAADHLRDKLGKAGSRVKTTEDFVDGVASSSYLTGKPYLVKFPDGHTEPVNGWLKHELEELRHQNK